MTVIEVVEVVGDAPGETTDDLHFSRPTQTLAYFFESA
jgi:hypothetical protein